MLMKMSAGQGSQATTLSGAFQALTPKQKKFVLSWVKSTAERKGLTGSNFFKSLFKKVLKPIGSKLITEVGLPILRNTAEKALQKKLGLGGKGVSKKRKTTGGSLVISGKPIRPKAKGAALRLAGRGVSVF